LVLPLLRRWIARGRHEADRLLAAGRGVGHATGLGPVFL
jgi:hypothetical protein